MKKTMLLFIVAGSIIAGIASCKKEEMPATVNMQTFDVSLKVGESYTFSLPESVRNIPYEISSEAKHASVSTVCVDSTGTPIYKYTPEPGYSGSDQVIISNDRERNQNCTAAQGPPPGETPRGACGGGKEEHYIITLNFTMEENATPASK
jgi:hypothetical protein